MPDLSSRRVALITGGSRGIGLGIALALAREDFDLALSGRRPAHEVRDVVGDIESLGARVMYQASDVALAVDRSALLAAVRRDFGRLDVLVNNAGVGPAVRADILEATEESFDCVLDTNLRGPYFLTQAVANWMVEQAAGRPAGRAGERCIVTITSVSAEVPSVNRGEYCISKAGLAMTTRLWAVRLAEYGIGVYEVRPGIVYSDMSAGAKDKYDRLIQGGLLLQPRWGTPEDVGRAVAMLVRGDLAYGTGSVVMVDGGMMVPRL